jgi:hypothetical protein
VIVRTHTVTVTNATPPPSGGGGEGAEATGRYQGTGAKTLGTINVSRDSTLRWTCEGACNRFSVFSSPEDENHISLSTGGHSGSASLPAGTYHEVRVTTGGTWTLKIE